MRTKTKEAGKTASFLKMLTSGTSPRVEVVKDTGAGKIPQQLKEIKVKKEQTKMDVPKINTDKTFKKNIVILNPENAFKGNNIADMTRSTAKNEKQRLYETNDTFLNNQELLKKYQYVADDKDMDYPTLRRAANNGIRTVGRVLKENKDMTAYKDVAELQVKLQSRLKSASFTAGMLDSISGDAMRIAAKASGNQVIQNQARAMQNQLNQMKNSNPTAGTMGIMTGELAKGAAGYATIGKIAERMALPVARKIGGGKALTKGKDFTARMIGQNVADTAVNMPLTVMAGLAEEKTKDEISKDVWKQIVTDAVLNVGQEGLTAVTGMVQAKNAQKRIPQQLQESMTGKISSNQYIKLGETPEILKRYGMNDGEMKMPQGVVPKIAYPAEYRQILAREEGVSEKQMQKIQGHNLGFEAIRQLPQKMKSPVAILKSDTQEDSLVVLTDMLDTSGRPIIVPIRSASEEKRGLGTIIPSVYGRKDFADFMERQEKKGNILYYDKKRNLHQLPNNGVQFPESFNASADPMLRIAQRKEKVNKKELENVKPGNKLAQAELQQLALQAHKLRKK